MVYSKIISVQHKKFVKDIYRAIKSNQSSTIPTFIFLIFTFLLTHGKIHKHTNRFTSFKSYVYREMVFQWIYFYLTKAWLFCVDVNSLATQWCQDRLLLYHQENQLLWLTTFHVQVLFLSSLLCASLVPCYLYIVMHFCKQHIPNFLLWIGDDPWANSELGMAGHYLERPPPSFALLSNQYRKSLKPRCRRTASLDPRATARRRRIIRKTKSLDLLNRKQSHPSLGSRNAYSFETQ